MLWIYQVARVGQSGGFGFKSGPNWIFIVDSKNLAEPNLYLEMICPWIKPNSVKKPIIGSKSPFSDCWGFMTLFYSRIRAMQIGPSDLILKWAQYQPNTQIFLVPWKQNELMANLGVRSAHSILNVEQFTDRMHLSCSKGGIWEYLLM